MKKRIGISKSNSSFDKYVNWIETAGYPFEVLDWEKDNFDAINGCSSLLLTGGVDIFPEFYADWTGSSNEIEGGKSEDFIPERDGFEFKLLDSAFKRKMPILGICRGMQLINCRLNGSLINDIETIRGVNHRKIRPGEDRYHTVNIKDGTILEEITGVTSGTINSSHHQSLDRLGEGLMISARSDDGIIEGVEWSEKDGKPFFLGIQWHPERIKDMSGPFSKNILERFIEETDKN